MPAITGTSSSANTSGSQASLTFSHSATGDVLYISIAVRSLTVAVASVTYGGVSLALLGSASAGTTWHHEWWVLPVPVAGTANVVITLDGTGTAQIGAGARNVSGVDLDGLFRNLTTASGTSTTPSVTVTSTAGDLVLDLVAYATSTTLTVGAGQTSQFIVTTGGATDTKVGGSSEAGAASVVMSWTLSGSSAWSASGLSIPAAGTVATLEGRVTQLPVEVLSQPTPTGRVSQAVVEVLGSLSSVAVPGQVTQLVVETLQPDIPPPPATLTQLVVELLTESPPPIPMRASQQALEVFLATPAAVRSSQVAVELFLPRLVPVRATQHTVEWFNQTPAATRVTQVIVEIFRGPANCPTGFPYDEGGGGSCVAPILP